MFVQLGERQAGGAGGMCPTAVCNLMRVTDESDSSHRHKTEGKSCHKLQQGKPWLSLRKTFFCMGALQP